jgi:hypothetical protein
MRILLPLLLLAACGAQPTPTLFGAERFSAVRYGREYVVYQKDKRVEVIRLGYARRGEHQAIRATMMEVVETTTGCKIQPTSWQGDSGEMRGFVTCGRGR